MTRPTSQNDRILDILSDGKWHTATNLERRTGARRLNSRISELRRHGHQIVSEKTGKSGPLGHRYKLTNPVHRPVDPSEEFVLSTEEIAPRDAANRYRIYRAVYDKLELLATATTPEDVGSAIVTLGLEKEFAEATLGILDTHGTDKKPGTWVVNPFDTVPLKGKR